MLKRVSILAVVLLASVILVVALHVNLKEWVVYSSEYSLVVDEEPMGGSSIQEPNGVAEWSTWGRAKRLRFYPGPPFRDVTDVALRTQYADSAVIAQVVMCDGVELLRREEPPWITNADIRRAFRHRP